MHMAKKTTDTTNIAASPRAAAAPAPASANMVAEAPTLAEPTNRTADAKPAPTAPKTKRATTAPKAKPSGKTAARPKKIGFTQDDVALRAYFIAENRRAAGLPGDEHSDWIEAERQLKAESTRRGKTKSA
jgi:Protein of unknown function (DUF2934)